MTASSSSRFPLHVRILIGLVGGACLGGILNAVLGDESAALQWLTLQVTEPLGQLFLRLLLMLVVPLVFCSLVLGVAGIGDIRRVGRVGVKCLIYTVVISAISVVIGLTMSNLVRPGTRIDPTVSQRLQERYGKEAEARVETAKSTSIPTNTPLMAVIKSIVPTNVVQAAASDPPDMLGLMFFSLFIGITLTLIGESAQPVIRVLEGAYEAVAKGIHLVMMLAPYAVFALLFTMTARFGFPLLFSLGWFVVTVLTGLALQMFVVYSLSVAVLSRISPFEFFRRIKTVVITAFSTSSSNATLPTALRECEHNLGVPRDINSFVLTVGATANQNGTALFEGVTVLFLAQFAGIDLTLGQQLMVLYMAILGGIGTAGVPAASIPFIVVVLSTIGVNPALIALVIGVDRILDMCRTVVNVVGDLTAATYIARSEGAKLLPPLGTEEAV
ncbi:MAG: dicarboxylate/amino acid:cation symporter [Candidatus Hydrogenedentes bacterium]|nr:dicarboxylate/amino acid:cation symporter [Candidatus Hydrogenedentota bacterium]